MFINNEHSTFLKTRTSNFSPVLFPFPQIPKTPLPLPFRIKLQMESLKDCIYENWASTAKLDGTIADPFLYGEYFT